MTDSAQKHPKGMITLCLLQLLGMIGFSMFLALLVLYVTSQLHFSDRSAYQISAAFNALVFITSVPGGFFAERYFGYFKGAMISIILCSIGSLLVAIPTTTNLYLGLSLFTFGTGMMVPCFYVMLGHLYPKHHIKREVGFVLAYAAMNLGSFIASAMSGSISLHYSYAMAFIIGGVTSAIMIPILWHYKRLLDEQAFNQKQRITGYGLTVLATLITGLILRFAGFSDSLLITLGILTLIYTIGLSLKQPSKHARNKLLVFVLLTSISILFWTLYSLAPSLLTLFTHRNVDRQVLGSIIPTANFSALNPFFIVTLAPLISLMWQHLDKKHGFKFSLASKFGHGLVLMGAGYVVLTLGIADANTLGMMALSWLVLSYLLQTLGEVFIGPIGYAMVGELVPTEHEGLMMGIWQLAAGIAGALSDWLAEYSQVGVHSTKPLLTNPSYSHAFLLYGSITIALGLLTYAMTPAIKRLLQAR